MNICLSFYLIQTEPIFIFWLKCNPDEFWYKCKPDKCLFRFKGKLDLYLFCKSSAKQTMLTFDSNLNGLTVYFFFFLLKCKPDQFLLFIQMQTWSICTFWLKCKSSHCYLLTQMLTVSMSPFWLKCKPDQYLPFDSDANWVSVYLLTQMQTGSMPTFWFKC